MCQPRMALKPSRNQNTAVRLLSCTRIDMKDFTRLLFSRFQGFSLEFRASCRRNGKAKH